MSTTVRQTLTNRDYNSDEVYALEQDRIWFKEWVYVGRSEQVAEAGQFFTVDIAGESILVTRNDEGDLRAFYNVCRHRGSVLCEEASGTTKAVFQCPYHGWSYGTNGALVGVPTCVAPGLAVPAACPESRIPALMRVVEHCTVHNSLRQPPVLRI